MTPYTYLIGWSKHNKFYYGVRYAKNSNPKELWITYVKPDDTTNYKNAAKLRWSNPEFKALQKSRKWINDGIKSKMVLSQELSHYLNSGWNLGRVGG